MPTKLHTRERQVLGYLMQHLGDAPGYSVWVESHGNWYESNLAYLEEVKANLEITPSELWLQMLACYTMLTDHLLKGEQQVDTTQVTRVEVIGEARLYTNNHCKNVRVSFQDNDRTIKVFLNSNSNDNQPQN